MTRTTIYLSVTRGTDNLVLDGNLYLLKELITMLNKEPIETTEMNSKEHEDENNSST